MDPIVTAALIGSVAYLIPKATIAVMTVINMLGVRKQLQHQAELAAALEAANAEEKVVGGVPDNLYP